MTKSRVIRGVAGDWADIEPRRYRNDEGEAARFLDVTRYPLLGADSDGAGSGLNFEVRYFEVAPGGYSSLERHAHPHAVVIVKGRGTVRLGETAAPVSALDVVYVAPHDVHRFSANAGEALGFVCVVDRDRDRPVAVSENDDEGVG